MVKITKTIVAFSALVFLAACGNAPKADQAGAESQKEVSTATGTPMKLAADSRVTWEGASVHGNHQGTFAINAGELLVNGGKVVGGKFTIDIKSLSANMEEKDGKGDLEGHLKGADFFDAEKFATAAFEITSITDFKADATTKVLLKEPTSTVSGNFTLKGVTKNISFPAKITVTENGVSANTEFLIDRSQWGLNYKGQNNPKDWVISKEVNIKFALNATK